MDDLPVLRKCCFCVPLRYGLLTWGYIKLAAAILALKFFIIILVYAKSGNRTVITDDGGINIIIGLMAVIAAEIILHVVFIIGAHKKNVKLLQAYYNYASITWVIMLIITILFTGFVFICLGTVSRLDVFLLVMFNVGFYISLTVQTFFVVSLNSEIIKLRSNCPYRIVKDENDPEGTINSMKDEEEMSLDNGTLCITEKEESLFSKKA